MLRLTLEGSTWITPKSWCQVAHCQRSSWKAQALLIEPVVPVFLSILIYTHIICQCRLSIDHICIYVYIYI